MAESERGEKTEEATPQRREDFRRRGQVAQTKELGSVLLLFTIVLCIWLMSRFYLQQITELFNTSFGNYILGATQEGNYATALMFAGQKIFILVAPIAVVIWLISGLSSVIQIGFLYNEDALQFNLERLDPIQGFKRIFSLKALVEGVKSILKLIAVSTIAYFVMRNEILRLPHLVEYDVSQLFEYFGIVAFKLLASIGFFMGVIAGLDFLFQRWDLEKEMMMTKQELREEMKSREGDPLIRARIKRVQREMANKRMMEAIPKADVVITNPTHIAVVLKYDDSLVAPKLVAKGADYLAEKIKALAKEHNIPTIENKPLARTIYKTMKIGQMIPRELYTAVAEVLSYVYKLKRKLVR